MLTTYEYTARESSTGKKVKSELQADSEAAAIRLLKERGFAPLDIEAKSGDTAAMFSGLLKRVSTKQKVIFSRQLSTLINAGLPIVQSLRSVNDQITNQTFKDIIDQVIRDVEAGSTFADSLAKYPKVFNKVFVNLVAAGESSGTLDKSLERLADQQEKDAEVISKVRGAMIYPAIVLLVMTGIVIFMLTTVLPQVRTLYDGLPGARLPLLTRVLLAISHALTHYWWIALVVLIVGVFFTTRWARTGPGKQVIDRIKMRAWPFGPLFVKLYMARFARTASTLVASGVPMLQMLGITAESINNVHVEESIKKAAEKVKGGKSLSESLEGDSSFTELVPDMIKIGEESGSLEAMLGKTADYYEKEVDNQIKAISTLVEPVLMIVLGIVAFLVVAAVLLPIYGLVGHIGTTGLK